MTLPRARPLRDDILAPRRPRPPRAAAPALSGQPSSGRGHSPVDLRVRVEVGPAKPEAVRDRHLIQALPGPWTRERDACQSVPDRSAVVVHPEVTLALREPQQCPAGIAPVNGPRLRSAVEHDHQWGAADLVVHNPVSRESLEVVGLDIAPDSDPDDPIFGRQPVVGPLDRNDARVAAGVIALVGILGIELIRLQEHGVGVLLQPDPPGRLRRAQLLEPLAMEGSGYRLTRQVAP